MIEMKKNQEKYTFHSWESIEMDVRPKWQTFSKNGWSGYFKIPLSIE